MIRCLAITKGMSNMLDEKNEFFKDRPFGIDSEDTSSELAVSVLLKRFPTIGSLKELKTACKSQTSSSRVTLSWLSEEFPSFPVRMAYKKVPWVRDMWDGLYNRFKKTDLYSSWKEEEDNWKLLSEEEYLVKPMAVVFNWPKWKMCCMHNCESTRFGGVLLNSSYGKTSDVLKIVRVISGETFVIEPFDQFLGNVSWSK